jgi:serine O-acetyltransferase
MSIREFMTEAFDAPEIQAGIRKDLEAVIKRDPASHGISEPFLHYKGFHALESYRVSHWLWQNSRQALACYLQNRISEVFAVDIHPAAKIGKGILIDHATSVVIGETAVVDDDVSMLHEVTLGGTGKTTGDRHPKVRRGVLIGAGAKILGNVIVGEGSKIAAGSVVLTDVPPHTTVAGVPAVIVGKPTSEQPSLEMDHRIGEKQP